MENIVNKKSVWSTMLLVASALFIVLTIINIVRSIIVMPIFTEQSRSIAEEMFAEASYPYTEEDVDMTVRAAEGLLIVGLIFVSAIDCLVSLGGFLFSHKGKWGVFCIIVGIIGVLSKSFDFTNLNKESEILTVVLTIIGFLAVLAFCVSSIMHYRENKALREEQTI